MRCNWSYLWATLRVGLRTAWVFLVAGLAFACGAIGIAIAQSVSKGGAPAWPAWVMGGAMCLGSLYLGGRILWDYFARRARHGPVWEWPDEIVQREERLMRQFLKGTELIAADPVEGSGTELESIGAPEGRGTELTAGAEAPEGEMVPGKDRPHGAAGSR